MLAVPLVGLTVVMVSVSPSTSLSLTSALMVTATSSSVLVESFTATGGWLAAVVTVTVISELVLPLLPLLMRPDVGGAGKFVAGLKANVASDVLAVPLVGLALVIVSVSPSTSLSLTSALMVTATSSSVLVESFTATGGWLAAVVTVTVISALALPPLPSLM